jgi:tyrosine-protein phosphatase
MFGDESVASATNLFQSTTLETIVSPTEGPQIQAKVDEEQNFDIPLSKEEKPEAYPDGPICVHEPNIDLYLEPTAEQARHYDVVLNVAVEVRNPLDPHAEPKSPEPEIRLDGGGGIQYAPKREQGFQEQRQPSSPTTPKAATSGLQSTSQSSKDPEYVHIPWEHNSDIVPDLLRLVKLIDERVAENKRVLVHCQCGVSRSASLVVAYGLYKDRSLSVQEAYDAVKARSKWIGPNMVCIPTS